MPALYLEIIPFDEGYIIEVRWPDNAVERAPGLFATERAAKDCLSSDSFARWLEERSTLSLSRNVADNDLLAGGQQH
jgi:hypothetical protein